jgi:hypothetical protein
MSLGLDQGTSIIDDYAVAAFRDLNGNQSLDQGELVIASTPQRFRVISRRWYETARAAVAVGATADGVLQLLNLIGASLQGLERIRLLPNAWNLLSSFADGRKPNEAEDGGSQQIQLRTLASLAHRVGITPSTGGPEATAFLKNIYISARLSAVSGDRSIGAISGFS